MGSYLDRLNAEFEEITTGITTVLERATEEDREVKPDEQAEIDENEKRRETLQRSIDHYTAIEERTAKVAGLQSRAPHTPPLLTRPRPTEPEYDIAREFPTAGDYAAMIHRAWVRQEPDAIAAIERATAHQKTTDNPGIIPRPIVGPLINTMSGARPLIASVPNHPAPALKFDRPRVDQHVEVGLQAAEKDLTASQQMKINGVPVALDTWAGHVNISKQDIRWTQPSILQTIFDDFTRIYGRRTDNAACAEFVTAVPAAAEPLVDWTPGSIDKFLRDSLGNVMQDADDVLIDTIWMSLDVWSMLGGIRADNGTGAPLYNLPLTGGGDVLGLKPVVDPHFDPGVLIVGDAQFAEFWEDLEGFLTVDEPNVLGQMVGYAGYSDFVVVKPQAFLKTTVPVITSTRAAASKSSK